VREKIINRAFISKVILSSLILIISLNLIFSIAFSRDEYPSGFNYSDKVNPDEQVNYHFSNNILLSLKTNVFVDINIDYENRIENRQIEFIINNTRPISLNVSSKTSMGNFGMGNAPQQPKGQYQNRYQCFIMIQSNVSMNKITIRNAEQTQLGLNPSSNYKLGSYNPADNDWNLFETSKVLNESTSEYYLETEIVNLNADTEYYFSYFEIVPVFNSWIWVIIIVCIVGIASALIYLISRNDYFQYLRQRTVPIEKGAHRLSLDEVLENENRNQIIDLVLKEPGIHFNELLRKTELAAGNLVWHLDILETYKVIGKKRVGKFIAYFPYYQKNPLSNLDIKLSKSKLTLEILEMIEEEPGLWNNLITKKLEVDHKTIQYHINKLKELNLIRFRKEGRKKKIYPNLDAEYFEKKKDSENQNLDD